MKEVRRCIFKPFLDSPTDSEDQSWHGLLLSKGLQELATEVMSSFHAAYSDAAELYGAASSNSSKVVSTATAKANLMLRVNAIGVAQRTSLSSRLVALLPLCGVADTPPAVHAHMCLFWSEHVFEAFRRANMVQVLCPYSTLLRLYFAHAVRIPESTCL